jgi:signal transduction histidine kinase
VNVNEGIEDTLIMLHSHLKKGVNVTRDYDENLPAITASGGELNQVWTNLIDNAVDAMNGEGDLTVKTSRDGDVVVVQIIDSGPGIPQEMCDTLFDPFVTSKPVGEGTGLGLNISRNIIVQKHRGAIDVKSRPGRTCFEVRLPVDRRPTGKEDEGEDLAGVE